MNILNNDLLGNYVQIDPIKVAFTDILLANILTASIIDDNLTDSCVIRYNLYNLEVSADTPPVYTAQLMSTGTLCISGTDYTNWGGINSYVYTYIASQIPIVIIN
jgi:hypothetical protein